MIRGDPRGISGRINGSTTGDPMWGGPPPQQPPGPSHHHVTPAGPPPGPPTQTSKMVPPGPASGKYIFILIRSFHLECANKLISS